MSFLSDAEIVISALEKYYQESVSGQKPVINQVPLETLSADLDLSGCIADGRLTGKHLAEFLAKYLESTTRLLHPSQMYELFQPYFLKNASLRLVEAFSFYRTLFDERPVR